MKISGKTALFFPILFALIALLVLAWVFVRHEPMHMYDFTDLVRKQFTGKETVTTASPPAPTAGGPSAAPESAVLVLDQALYEETHAALQLIAQSTPLAQSYTSSLAMLGSLIEKFARLDPQNKWRGLQQALQDDREAYRRATPVNVLALAGLIDELALNAANLPLMSSAQLMANASDKKNAPVQNGAADSGVAPPVAGDWWQRIAQGLWAKLSDIVRIRRLDDLETRMAAENRSMLMTQRLQWHLQSARMSLLAREATVLSRDLDQIEALLNTAFDLTSPQVAQTKTKIAALRSQINGQGSPNVAKSLAALEVLYTSGPSAPQKANP
jgi:uroporphyrin-III C-methyltransferase